MDLNFDIPDWNAPAGRLLTKLAAALPPQPEKRIVVFGSAPLQLYLDSDFVSQDVDVLGDDDISRVAAGLKLPGETGDLEFQVCDRLVFRTALGWEDRARTELLGPHAFIFPHPWDILVAKIGRLEEKDLEAFRLVIRKTGHPTPEEFAKHLQLAVDLYRPNFDEERGSDYTTQTRLLWREIFDGDIDVRSEIIRPALARRQAQYDADAGDPAWIERLRSAGKNAPS